MTKIMAENAKNEHTPRTVMTLVGIKYQTSMQHQQYCCKFLNGKTIKLTYAYDQNFFGHIFVNIAGPESDNIGASCQANSALKYGQGDEMLSLK